MCQSSVRLGFQYHQAGVAQAMGINSRALLWLRYSGFLVLYPVGVASELTIAALALDTVRRCAECAHAIVTCFCRVQQTNEPWLGSGNRHQLPCRHRPLSVALPNSYNFAFDYYFACVALMAIYLPGEDPLVIQHSCLRRH